MQKFSIKYWQTKSKNKSKNIKQETSNKSFTKHSISRNLNNVEGNYNYLIFNSTKDLRREIILLN